MRATTTALVRDLDLSAADVRRAVEGRYAAAGIGTDVISAAEFSELVSATLEDLALRAQRDPGAVNARGPEPVRFWASRVQWST